MKRPQIDIIKYALIATAIFTLILILVYVYRFHHGLSYNHITEVQFYPILKDELDLLEKEMARLKELGQ